jgi:hypothetical protein
VLGLAVWMWSLPDAELRLTPSLDETDLPADHHGCGPMYWVSRHGSGVRTGSAIMVAGLRTGSAAMGVAYILCQPSWEWPTHSGSAAMGVAYAQWVSLSVLSNVCE